jgi:hypothetical protein
MNWLAEIVTEVIAEATGKFLTSRNGRPFLVALLVSVVLGIGCWLYFRQ